MLHDTQQAQEVMGAISCSKISSWRWSGTRDTGRSQQCQNSLFCHQILPATFAHFHEPLFKQNDASVWLHTHTHSLHAEWACENGFVIYCCRISWTMLLFHRCPQVAVIPLDRAKIMLHVIFQQVGICLDLWCGEASQSPWAGTLSSSSWPRSS